MAAQSPSIASALSPDDRRLLTRFIDLGQDLRALAADAGADYFALLDWLESPHIQTALAAHERAQARADRDAARSALRATLTTAPSPIERRRAATPLLRALDKPSPSPRGMGSGGLPMSTPPTKAPPTDSPDQRCHAGDEPAPSSSPVSPSTANPRVSSPSPHLSPSSLLALLLNPTSILNTPSSTTPHSPFPTTSPSTPAARLIARAGALPNPPAPTPPLRETHSPTRHDTTQFWVNSPPPPSTPAHQTR